MGMVKQQVYFQAKQTGPCFFAAVRQLADNPLAKYTMLQQRRRRARVSRWRRWLGLAGSTLVGLGMTALAQPGLAGILLGYSGGWLPWHLSLMLFIMGTGLFWYGIWLLQGVFNAVRDAVMMLSDSACVGRAQGVDELVATSALNDNELLAAILRISLAPLLGRVLVGAGMLMALNVMLPVVVSEAIHAHEVHAERYFGTAYSSPSAFYAHSSVAGKSQVAWLSAISQLLIGKYIQYLPALLLNVVLFAVHGVAGAVILLMLMLVAGRRTSNWSTATAAGVLNALVQYGYYIAMLWLNFMLLINPCFLDYYGLWDIFPPELSSYLDLKYLDINITILISIAATVIALRFLRNSQFCRYLVLAIPTHLSFFMLLILFNTTESSVTGFALQISLMYIMPGQFALAACMNIVDYFNGPYLLLTEYASHSATCYVSFTPLWLAKLILQAALLSVMLVLARDAVRLYRQPGTL